MLIGLSRAQVLIRGEPLRIGTPQQYQWLNGIVKGVIWLNLLDALFTLWWVRAGMAVEANQLLRDLAHENALAFVLAKLGLVSLGSLFLWRYRRHPLAVVAIFGAFLIYYLVLLHHLQFSSHFLRQFLGV
ncbi:MAG: DUF5658 family protein [Gemmatimonadota bacterium]